MRRSGTGSGAALASVLEADAETMLASRTDLQVAAGEVLPDDSDPDALVPWTIKNTLACPDAMSADASEARTTRAAELGILEMAVDAAESIGAQNSLEKMLAHQLAAAHDSAMRLLKRAFDPNNPPVEIARLTNAAARLMQVYAEGILTLRRIRAGGRQVIRVERMTVADGGRAIVGNFEGSRAAPDSGSHPEEQR